MGLCFSKRQQEKAKSPRPAPQPSAVAGTKPKKASKIAAAVATDEKAKKTPQPKRASNADESAAAGKKAAPIVVRAKAAAGGEEKKEEARPVVVSVAKGPAPVRTSSCTKEEVDAILIQCGRLSRSSSGTGMAASSETGGGGHRRHSGSKRSCDFDRERSAGGADEEGDWERLPVSRPSPHRGSPQRKRSGSRERTGGGSRRSSRSPGRRGEGAPSASSGGARQQPGKMVSVPAREKGPAAAAASAKKCASPRSSSPARVAAAGNENAGVGQKTAAHTPSLSRSSSRKAEQSPHRRSPMAEIDENSLRNSNIGTNAKPQKKSTEAAVATATRKITERAKEQNSQKEKAAETIVAVSETRAPSSKTTGTRTVSIVAENTNPRSGCRSRRASRDFDQNPNLYATHLLEDIQNYHTSAAATPGTPPSFTLPACVSKAQSIVDAVADLNSSSSGSRACEPGQSADDKGSVNAAVGGDDFVEPSVHRYVSVRDIRGRGETELQESAGSNTLSGNVWTPSRSSNNGDEIVEQPRQSKQRPAAQPEPSVRSRAGSSGVNAHRGRSAHRGSGSGTVASGRSGVRGVVSASS